MLGASRCLNNAEGLAGVEPSAVRLIHEVVPLTFLRELRVLPRRRQFDPRPTRPAGEEEEKLRAELASLVARPDKCVVRVED